MGATLGTALGALVVSLFTSMSWPMRIALVIGVLVVGLGYLLWSKRAEIAAEAEAQAAPSSPSTGQERTSTGQGPTSTGQEPTP